MQARTLRIICGIQEMNSQAFYALLIISCLPMKLRTYKKAQPQVNLCCAFFHIRIPQIILISWKTVALFSLPSIHISYALSYEDLWSGILLS